MSQQDVERDVDPVDAQLTAPPSQVAPSAAAAIGHGPQNETGRDDQDGPVTLPPAPETGDAQVDEAIARLADVARRPASEQVGVFEAVHGALTERLADVEG